MALTETAPSRSDTLSTARHEVHHPSDFLNVILLVYNTALASINNRVYNFGYELWPWIKRVSCRSWASLVAQMVKTLPCSAADLGWSLGWEGPPEKGMATILVFLPGESHGQRSRQPETQMLVNGWNMFIPVACSLYHISFLGSVLIQVFWQNLAELNYI